LTLIHNAAQARQSESWRTSKEWDPTNWDIITLSATAKSAGLR
jgi:hypothetical protein